MAKKPPIRKAARKPAKKSVRRGAGENDIDACDLEFDDDNTTPDVDLPAAFGGVGHATNDDDLDACEIDFKNADLTSDEDLPATTGGVG